MTRALLVALLLQTLLLAPAFAFVPFIDGGKGMPKLYDGRFNDQIAKQASTAVSKAVAAGKTKIEVNFPPVPNVDEVKFGTPLNQKFGKSVLAGDLKFKGGYKPGSDLSRNLIPYANVFWAKKIAGAAKGGALGGKPVGVLTAEAVNFGLVQSMGDLTRSGKIMSEQSRKEGRNGEVMICINPGGEESWDRILSAHASPGSPSIMLWGTNAATKRHTT